MITRKKKQSRSKYLSELSTWWQYMYWEVIFIASSKAIVKIPAHEKAINFQDVNLLVGTGLYTTSNGDKLKTRKGGNACKVVSELILEGTAWKVKPPLQKTRKTLEKEDSRKNTPPQPIQGRNLFFLSDYFSGGLGLASSVQLPWGQCCVWQPDINTANIINTITPAILFILTLSFWGI